MAGSPHTLVSSKSSSAGTQRSPVGGVSVLPSGFSGRLVAMRRGYANLGRAEGKMSARLGVSGVKIRVKMRCIYRAHWDAA